MIEKYSETVNFVQISYVPLGNFYFISLFFFINYHSFIPPKSAMQQNLLLLTKLYRLNVIFS